MGGFFFNGILMGIILWEYFSWRTDLFLSFRRSWTSIKPRFDVSRLWASTFPSLHNSPRKTKLDFPFPGYPTDCVESIKSSSENSILALAFFPNIHFIAQITQISPHLFCFFWETASTNQKASLKKMNSKEEVTLPGRRGIGSVEIGLERPWWGCENPQSHKNQEMRA